MICIMENAEFSIKPKNRNNKFNVNDFLLNKNLMIQIYLKEIFGFSEKVILDHFFRIT